MSKKLKTLCALICTAAIMLTMCLSVSGIFLEGANINTATPAGFEEVPVYLNGRFMSNALMSGGTSYVSIDEFCESILGQNCSLYWDSDEGTLTVASENLDLKLDLAQHYLSINSRYLYLSGGVYNIEGAVYVPIRPIAAALGVSLSVASRDEGLVIRLNYREGSSIENGETFYNSEDLYWLSRVIYAESGNQPLAGMIGVGNVVLNRVNTPSFPDSVYEVIFQQGQFSVVDNGMIYSAPSERAIIAAKLCLEGCNTVGDSLFFLNPEISSSAWFDSCRIFRMSIGEHYFYA
ncbi:MAG: cell wall hydrolase [Oscillospiraceae bacterium]|nr:cell wall hydrolase [Oscillospiraceae bacterium]